MALNGNDLGGKFGEQRGYVARTGADLEYPAGGSEVKGLQHHRHDIGLGDGLVIADRERMVFIRLGAIGCGNEFFAGDTKHGVEHTRVANTTAAELRVD